eukprot:g20720.t1
MTDAKCEFVDVEQWEVRLESILRGNNKKLVEQIELVLASYVGQNNLTTLMHKTIESEEAIGMDDSIPNEFCSWKLEQKVSPGGSAMTSSEHEEGRTIDSNESPGNDEISQTDTAFLQKRFQDLERSMQTLFQSISNGVTWGDVADKLHNLNWVWGYLYVIYVAFCAFCVLNVMTGVFCQSAIESAERDQELHVHRSSSSKGYTEAMQWQNDEEWKECLDELWDTVEEDELERRRKVLTEMKVSNREVCSEEMRQAYLSRQAEIDSQCKSGLEISIRAMAGDLMAELTVNGRCTAGQLAAELANLVEPEPQTEYRLAIDTEALRPEDCLKDFICNGAELTALVVESAAGEFFCQVQQGRGVTLGHVLRALGTNHSNDAALCLRLVSRSSSPL